MQAIASQISRNQSASPAFAQEFASRLVSLSSSHDLFVRGNWTGVNIAELVSTQLFHFKTLIGQRVLIRGPQLDITPNAAQDLGMAINELATNAAKFGALSNSEGCVLIGWSVVNDQKPQFQMSWIEMDGPAVETPTTSGFGTLVITRMLQASLNATISLQFAESGVQWMLQAPRESVILS